MTQIYANGELTYDSRVEDYDLLGLKLNAGLNKGGTLEIVMPASHPAYNKYTPYTTIVEVYRDDVLRFRGRVLYPTIGFDKTRTVLCEGELCFLQDVPMVPGEFSSTPSSAFSGAIANYNGSVEAFKRFSLGEVAVQNASEAIVVGSEEPQTVLDFINELLDLCGGYIVFTTNKDGYRVINWLDSVGKDSTQTIDAGENLYDFGLTYANTELCTAVVPYGAKDPATGKRLSVASVSAQNGKDILRDEEAIATHGTFMKALIWDEVTDPVILWNLAWQYLEEHKNIVTSLTVSALDLSYVDKDIECFKLGDQIRVISKAHGLDQRFQLIEINEDLLNPAQSTITLGKAVKTLTGLDVAGDINAQRGLWKTAAHARSGTQQTSDGLKELTSRVDGLQELIAKLPGGGDGTDNV